MPTQAFNIFDATSGSLQPAAIEETRTKFLDASAKNGVDSAQALAALKEYEAVLTSQTLVSPRTTPHAARASIQHLTTPRPPYNTSGNKLAPCRLLPSPHRGG